MAKVTRKEAWHTQRRDQASGNPPLPSIYPQSQSLPRNEESSGSVRNDVGEGCFTCRADHDGSFPALGVTRASQVKPLRRQTSSRDRVTHPPATTHTSVASLSTVHSTESLGVSGESSRAQGFSHGRVHDGRQASISLGTWESMNPCRRNAEKERESFLRGARLDFLSEGMVSLGIDPCPL